jgi:hypothetical protein
MIIRSAKQGDLAMTDKKDTKYVSRLPSSKLPVPPVVPPVVPDTSTCALTSKVSAPALIPHTVKIAKSKATKIALL